jgi:O-methyltransferase
MTSKKAIDHVANSWLDRLFQSLYGQIELLAMRPYNEKRLIDLIRRVKREKGSMLLKPSEAAIVFYLAEFQNHTDGDYAEVGSYKGGSTKMICEAKQEAKVLHAFDAFERGIPFSSEVDSRFLAGMFKSSYRQFMQRLSPYKNVRVYRGIFPDSAAPVEKRKFSFVHLDVDVYQTTLASLDFFYPRLTRGGIIISHDYPSAAGVKKAFTEFLSDKPEPIMQLPMSQCLIIKQ